MMVMLFANLWFVICQKLIKKITLRLKKYKLKAERQSEIIRYSLSGNIHLYFFRY